MKLRTPTRLALAVAASLTMASAHADSLSFSRMYTLGDSLTDGGAYSNTAYGGLAIVLNPLLPPDINYRFTNNASDGSSRVYAETLADLLGLDLPVIGEPLYTGDKSDGGNYAQGGSRVSNPTGTSNNPGAGITTFSVRAQVDSLLSGSFQLNEHDLAIVWAGANDGFAQFGAVGASVITSTEALANMGTAARELGVEIGRLKDAGARNVVVILVPDLAQTPFGNLIRQASPGGEVLLTALSGVFNETLKTAASQQNVFVFDSNKVLSAVIDDPARFGFNTDTLDAGTLNPAASEGTACGRNPGRTDPTDWYNSSLTCISTNPNSFLFADGVHPTTQAHDIFAAILMGSLRAIGQASYLATGPMISARQHAMELENRLHLNAFSKADGKSRPVGDTQVYGGAESGGFKQGSGQIDPSVDLSSQRYRIGIDQQLTSSVMGGALFTYGQSKTDFGSNTGEIKTNEVSAVLYASKALSANTYINASFGMGTIDHSFRREIALDTTTLVSRSSPKGEYESFRIGGGAVYEVNGWRIGPSASFALENVTIDQFDENQGPSSMSFGKIDYSVQRLTAGLSLDQIASVGQWRGFGRLVHDWDLKSSDLEIKVGPDSATLAKFDIDRPGKTMWQATLGIMRPATDGSTLSFSVGFGGREGGGDTKTIGVNYRIEL